MTARRRLVAAVVVTAALLAADAVADATGSRTAAPTLYSLRGDPRMCPSPMCGGFWASRVNWKLTPCLGGSRPPACYVASADLSALAPASRTRAQAALSSGRALVEGVFARYPSAYAHLARLVAARVWLSPAAGPTEGVVYRVVDTGIRCIRAPCFSLRATIVNGTRAVTLSDLDLAASGAPRATITRARALLAHGGILVTGTVRTLASAGAAGSGRTFAATRLWLPA